MGIIVIQRPLLGVFSTPLIRTYNHTIINTVHHHSTNSCFLIIPIHLGFYYQSTWSHILLK